MRFIWQKKLRHLGGALISLAAFFIFCSPLLAAEPPAKFNDGDLVRAVNSWRVYAIACGKRVKVKDASELAAKYAGKTINVITPKIFAKYPAYGPADAKTCPPQKDKLIRVDLKTQTLAYFENGKKIKEFKISSGVKALPTPTGVFSVLDKVPVKAYGGGNLNFYYPNTKWNLHFATDQWRYYIHGAYWHNNFGHPMSHGCVNVSYANMESLYKWADVGTKVVIN